MSRTFLKVRLRYARGKLLQQRIQKVHHPRPPKRRRIVGRFLAMVYQGKRLVDVVPFNFPLLAPVENFTYTGQRIATQMEAHLVTAAEIEVPWVPAVDHIVIRDVGTERRWPLNLAPLTPRPRAPAPRPAPPRGAPPARSSQ